MSASSTVNGVSAATLSQTTRPKPTDSRSPSGECVSAMVGSSADAARTSGAATEIAAESPPGPNEPRSSWTLRVTSAASWMPSPTATSTAAG